jgi:hypothetical protein
VRGFFLVLATSIETFYWQSVAGFSKLIAAAENSLVAWRLAILGIVSNAR